jgi:hypothetical protein
MIICAEELRYCFENTAEIEEQYKLTHIGSDDPRKPVDNLISTCESYLKSKIQLLKLTINSKTNPRWGTCIEKEQGV